MVIRYLGIISVSALPKKKFRIFLELCLDDRCSLRKVYGCIFCGFFLGFYAVFRTAEGDAQVHKRNSKGSKKNDWDRIWLDEYRQFLRLPPGDAFTIETSQVVDFLIELRGRGGKSLAENAGVEGNCVECGARSSDVEGSFE